MKQFGENVIHSYLFIVLVNGAVGLTEVLSTFLGWQQTWFTVLTGILSLIFFIVTFFFLALFYNYKVQHVYYILPLYYIISYLCLSTLAFIVSWKEFSWTWFPMFLMTVAFLSSSFEIVFSAALLGKISAFKKHLKRRRHRSHRSQTESNTNFFM